MQGYGAFGAGKLSAVLEGAEDGQNAADRDAAKPEFYLH